MPESVRLVIWDLDETLWRGTLSEGGISEHVAANYDIIRELARRGIMSSICSKNDRDAVEAVLREQEVWDFFVFPSIEWSPKGHRLQAIIEAMQLRPASVLFVDDNHGNRAEAAALIPDLQIVSDDFIPSMLADPRFVGKDDGGLTRLAQYKLLEKRNADQLASTGSNVDFLRKSNIRIYIETDVEKHIDRVIELIERTNQLNFTKKRLSGTEEWDSLDGLKQHIRDFRRQAGLIQVADDYGDYGFCGFYLLGTFFTGRELEHFCFSCRTLGMGVESYVYQLLGAPQLTIAGEVLSNPITDPEVDWITLEREPIIIGAPSARDDRSRPFRLRGGCDLMAIGHYASLISDDVRGEYSSCRDVWYLRTDHSAIARLCLEAPSPGVLSDLHEIGYTDSDLNSEILAEAAPGTWLLSFSPDAWAPLFRHNETGVLVPFLCQGFPTIKDPAAASCEERATLITDPRMQRAVDTLARAFTYIGTTPEPHFKQTIRMIAERATSRSAIFVILNKDTFDSNATPTPITAYNRWTTEALAGYDNVRFLRTVDFVTSDAEWIEAHPDRLGFRRMFEHIRDNT